MLENLKNAGFIFRKYTGVEKEETITINGEVLIVPTRDELTKAFGSFPVDTSLTDDEISNSWIALNVNLKEQISLNTK